MSVEAMSWAFAVDLPPCPKSVLVSLANRADEQGYCYPGIEDMERRTGWKRRAVQNAVRYLMGHGLIIVQSQFSNSGRQRTNLYRLAIGAQPTTIACGEGAPDARIGVHQMHGEGAPDAPPRVHQMHGEGAPGAPKSSSESSKESSSEHSVGPAPDNARGLWVVAEGILEFLNKKTGRHYQPRKPNKDPTASLKAVHGLLKCGYTEQQLRQVIGNRLVKWGDDPKMHEFLRPETLFRPSKFEQYLGEVGAV